jgi:hypothetical protein
MNSSYGTHLASDMSRFPHSGISGLKRLFVSYPKLIADCHALLRLHLPRHPPYALFCFNLLFQDEQNLTIKNSTHIQSIKIVKYNFTFSRLNIFYPVFKELLLRWCK